MKLTFAANYATDYLFAALATRPAPRDRRGFFIGHSMHQRQAGSYARRFHYGKHSIPGVHDLSALGLEPGIGLIPPEFDDLQGGELELKDELRAEPHLPR